TMSCWKKKNRGRNFTPEEELVLTMLAEEKKSILENRKSDALTWRRKMEAWKEIADCYYHKTGYRREWKALREKCINMKRRRKVKKKPQRDCEAVTAKAELSLSATLGNALLLLLADADNNVSYTGDEDMLPEAATVHEEATEQEDLANTSSDWANSNPSISSCVKQETITLLRLQQDFVRCKNQRAQERHEQDLLREKLKLEQELQEGKLRIELIELQLLEKRAQLSLKSGDS
ncbi:hypothetical protein KR222_002909, partial [Zaprionus bogoriensis]